MLAENRTDLVDKKRLSDDPPPEFPMAGPSGSQYDSSPLPPDDGDVPKYTERPTELPYVPPGGEEPPPEFTPYEAEFSVSGNEIISHDPHLNEDGEQSV